MKTHIITTFDKNHLHRAVTLRENLRIQAPEAHVRLLCLDELCYETAKKLNLANTTVMRAENLGDAELLEARKNRTTPEFASTIKPAFLLYMMKSGIVASDDLLAFIDPDFLFYQRAEPLFEKAYSSGSIVVTPHRFPKEKEHEQYKKGFFNAGIVFFKNDAAALECLEEWRKQCIDWCFLRYEDGKIGDQGYMSAWPEKYKNVYQLVDKGVNLSTWNISNYTISRKPDGYFVDEEPLVCYHFHGLKFYLGKNSKVKAYPVTVYHSQIYKDYLNALTESYKKLAAIDPLWQCGFAPKLGLLRTVKQKVWKVFS